MNNTTTLSININGEAVSIECTADQANSLEAAVEQVQATLRPLEGQENTSSKLLLSCLLLAREVSELKHYKSRSENLLRELNTRLSTLIQRHSGQSSESINLTHLEEPILEKNIGNTV